MKIPSPLVSVIIPAWNEAGALPECLQSVISSTYRNMEVIVVDNGSTDGTGDIVRKEFPSVMVIRNDTNLGFSGALNTASSLSKGEYILWLNSDASIGHEWIETMIENFEKDSRLGMASSVIVYRGPGSVIWSAGGIIDGLTGLAWDYAKGEAALGLTPRLDIDYVAGCATMVRRGALKLTGGLDSGYFIYFEDAELGLRFKRAGYRIAILSSMRVRHSELGDSGSHGDPSNKLFLFAKSNFRFVLKNWPLPRVLVAFVACFSFYVGFSLVKGPRSYAPSVIRAAAWNLSQFGNTRKLGRIEETLPLPSTKIIELARFIMRMIRHPELFSY